MELTVLGVKKIFLDVISYQISREDADLWASKMIKYEESGELVYSPPEDEDKVWSGVIYLLGIDLKISRDEYLLSMDDLIAAYHEKLGP